MCSLDKINLFGLTSTTNLNLNVSLNVLQPLIIIGPYILYSSTIYKIIAPSNKLCVNIDKL